MGAKGFLPGPAAEAHSRTQCAGIFRPVIDSPGGAPGKSGLRYKLSPSLNGDAQTAAVEAANSWAFFTDVSMTPTDNNFPAWDIYFTAVNDPDASLAGTSSYELRAGTNGCWFEGGRALYNTNHVGGAGSFADTDKRCIYLHEAAHVMGLAHSNIADHNDGPAGSHSAAESVMLGRQHTSRCHVSSPPLWPGSADIADINAKY